MDPAVFQCELGSCTVNNVVFELEVGWFQGSIDFKLAMDERLESHSALQPLTWNAELKSGYTSQSGWQVGCQLRCVPNCNPNWSYWTELELRCSRQWWDSDNLNALRSALDSSWYSNGSQTWVCDDTKVAVDTVALSNSVETSLACLSANEGNCWNNQVKRLSKASTLRTQSSN